MTGSTPQRKVLWAAAILCAVLLLDPASAASSAKASGGDTDSGDGGIPDAVAGPIVRAVVDRLKDANTTDALEKKKTIAQMIDEALEQEFPEEKEEKIGKNFNETAKNSDVSCGLSSYVVISHITHCDCSRQPHDMANSCRQPLRQF